MSSDSDIYDYLTTKEIPDSQNISSSSHNRDARDEYRNACGKINE